MKDSAIQWTDHTFNPWEGCTKVAPECKNCYAEVLVDHRFHRAKWGKGQPRRRTSENLWKQPLAWNKTAICTQCGQPELIGSDDCRTCGRNFASNNRRCPRVFCLSLGDWLDDEVPLEWLANLLDVIRRCRNLDWQLLTKRPQNWMSRMVKAMKHNEDTGGDPVLHAWILDWVTSKTIGDPPDNIWIGVSAGADQKAALEIPAKVHFLSCEPMLHALDTTHAAGFDQIIFGGESGKSARTCHIEWISEGVRFCQQHNIAPFVKQLGAVPVTENANLFDWPDDVQLHTGKPDDHGFAFAYIKLRDSHGGDMREWPEDLRVREFPACEANAERRTPNAQCRMDPPSREATARQGAAL